MAPGLVAATPALSIPCLHCGRASGESFCCEGCEAVFAILHSRGLSEYYALKKTGGWLRQPLPAAVPGRSYTYLDDPAFLKLYAMSAPGGGLEMTFYAEGIHCVACVWLLEKLPELVKGLSSVRLDLGSSTALVRIPEGGSFAAAAREFERLGYRPHPVRGEELEQHQKRENRQMLIRLGIAGACHGNLMLLAVSLYGGATGTLAKAFSWVSLALFLPVAIYSAVPFYRDAWVSLRTRRISIDVPIALGVVGGTLASTVNLFRGSSHIYFDSLSSLVFLLLGSRYLLKRAHENAFRSSKLLHFLMPSSVRRRLAQTESYEQVGIEVIAPGDVVKVLPNEPIPVDGTVIAGRSTIHCALLTGESDPVGVGEGEIVHAGTVNQASVLEIRATGAGYATRLGRILKAIEEGAQRKAPIVTLTDAVARRFVGAVLVFAALAWLGTGWHLGWEAGFERALALLIITCPCGLALATPLALSISIGKAARSGLLIKGADVLERLARVDKVFLDKTGTLTTGEFEVLEWSVAPGDERIAAHAAVALESRSNHPIAKAVVRHLIRSRQVRDADRLPAVEDFEETAGKGVAGRIEGRHFELRQEGRSEGAVAGGTTVVLLRDGARIARAELGDRLREDSVDAVARLRELGLEPRVLSGDAEGPVARVARELGIPPEHAVARASPERKSELIREHGRALMVGDGANDAIALSSAFVGVATHGGMEVSLRAADVYLSRPGVTPVLALVMASRETMKVLRRNLVFSLVYNLAGGAAALLGYVNPLVAAVLMPASALTVFLSSIHGTRSLRRSLR